MKFLLVLTALSWPLDSCGHNILVFLPNPMWSQYNQVELLFHALAKRGHNMTVVSPYPPKNKTTNFTHILLSADRWVKNSPNQNMMEWSLSNRVASRSEWKDISDMIVPQVLESTAFRDLTHGDNKFDLIFMELFFAQEALVVLGHLFNAPIVTYSFYGYDADILRYSGAANAVGYLPFKELEYAGPMSLGERLENAWIQYSNMLYNEYWYYPHHDVLLAKHFPGPLPRITDMLRNVSLYFLTGNAVLDGAKLYPPNVIEISGLHTEDPAPLDEELELIMSRSKSGVIFFSFGSLLKASNMRKEAVLAFLSVFKELHQTVLWKSDLNPSEWTIPNNVYVRKWFDQKSILAHPNCVLFLTHCGISSTMEAIRYAVPVVGMPFYADQNIHVAYVEYFGYGVHLSYKNLTENSLRWALKTVLENPRFKDNISRASKVFSDKLMSPLDTAIYWIEYVIRHKGAHHLRPLAAKIPWYQLFLLDVVAVYLLVFVVIIYLAVKLLLFFLGQSAQIPKSSSDKKKKQK
ncbi:UDP-glycosyltransferase UGT4 isoform X2 [Bemisia tabaci]